MSNMGILVFFLCIAFACLFVLFGFAMKRISKLEDACTSLALAAAKLDERTSVVSEEMTAMRANIDYVNGVLDEKTSQIKQEEKARQMWEDGLANIMNYSVDKAKGGDKK